MVFGVTQGGYGGDGAKDLLGFIDRHKLTYPILFSPPFAPIYQVKAKGAQAPSPYPINILIDKAGKIAFISNTYDPAELLKAVRKELGL